MHPLSLFPDVRHLSDRRFRISSCRNNNLIETLPELPWATRQQAGQGIRGEGIMGAAVGGSSGDDLLLWELPLPLLAVAGALSVANVLTFFPLLARFLPFLRYWGPLHYRPISDNPVRGLYQSR